VKKFLFLISVLITIEGCSVFRSIKVENINSIKLKIDSTTNLNYGFQFPGKLMAYLDDGDSIDVTTHSRFKFESEGLSKLKKSDQFIVNEPYMDSYDTDYIEYKITYQRGKKSVQKEGVIQLNFRGGYQLIDHSYRDNSDKINEKSIYTVVIWKSQGFYHMYFINRGWKYKTRGDYPFVFDLKGSKGKQGNRGKPGRDGSDGRGKMVI